MKCFFFLLYWLHVLFLFFFSFFMNTERNITGEDCRDLLKDCSSIKRKMNGDIYRSQKVNAQAQKLCIRPRGVNSTFARYVEGS